MSLKEELTSVVRGEVENTPEVLEHYSRDASLFMVRPDVVVHPLDAKDVCKVVSFVREKKKAAPTSDLSITARAAGTDMSGGPLNTSIILDTLGHLNHIGEIDAGYGVVEPGVYFRDFDRETKKHNLELPSYTASRELNTVGGMVANNSGGEKNLKYGKTARYVEKLDVVLSDGAVHRLKNLSGPALEEKCKEGGFEGDLYRAMSSLVATHKDLIKAHTPTGKNSSGYALWDIGDGIQSLNLARLMVGAQGTLGIITNIRFSLIKPKPYGAMTVVFLHSLSQLGQIVPQVLAHKPDSFESYDDHTFRLAARYFFEFAAQMKSNLVGLFFSFLPELWIMVRGGVPKLVLMVEFRGNTQEEALTHADDLAAEILNTNEDVRVRVAESDRQARKYWVVRRESFNLLRHKLRNKRTLPFIDDFVVPPESLPEFLPQLETILSSYTLRYTIAGHVGDGNFHIIPLADPREPGLAHTIDALSHKVYDLVLSYHGSITGEHNDGYARTPYVEKMFGKEMYALFHQVKTIFDPLNIFNPGKKIGLTFSDTLARLDLPPEQLREPREKINTNM